MRLEKTRCLRLPEMEKTVVFDHSGTGDQKKEQAGGRSSCHPSSEIIQPQVQIISGNHRVNPV
jgi:hypothetical protein